MTANKNKNIMPKALAALAVLLISALNLGVVFGASVLGVYGDGTPGAMPFIWAGGLIWVSAFTIRALYWVWRGRGAEGIGLCALTLPFALWPLIAGSMVWIIGKRLF